MKVTKGYYANYYELKDGEIAVCNNCEVLHVRRDEQQDEHGYYLCRRCYCEYKEIELWRYVRNST